jgi:peptidoglycan/xylan/chitin deacetylase (PgdA/CDA1 family)
MLSYKQTITFLIVVCCLSGSTVSAQVYQTNTLQGKSDFQWPEGKKMALSLTFDDARLSQVDKGIPILDQFGVKATFYVLPKLMEKRMDAWVEAFNNGHEIGNHSISHPCSSSKDFSRHNTLEDYTIDDIIAELDSADKFIEKMLGIKPVSFAYPCGHTFVGKGRNTKSYVPVVSMLFESGRGWHDEDPNNPALCDLSQLTGMELDGKTFEEIKQLIESSKNKGKWLILVGHEMDLGGKETSLLPTIEAICKYASDTSNGIWIDNVHNIASYIKDRRGEALFIK